MSGQISAFGVDAVHVRFSQTLTDAANRAALSFQAALEGQDWPGVQEISAALVSVVIRFDPGVTDASRISARLRALLDSRDWTRMPVPAGHRLWEVPTVFGTDLAPQLAEAAALAGLTPAQAIDSLTAQPLRVQTIGFAPGQPYLGTLGPEWGLPRQTHLTPHVPVGAVTVAIRQVVLFSVPSPTGWRHVGQSAVTLFDPTRPDPFLLRAGDHVLFRAVDRAGLDAARAQGGAQVIPWR
jgi:KipI family sensor histidine kinase inhibitor